MSTRSAYLRLGSLGTGAITGFALAVQTGLAAVVGVIVAREFGRTAETDGFFAAYAVFVVILLAANSIRVVVLPPLARARNERRLGAEVTAYTLTLASLAVPLLVAASLAAHPLSWLLTGNGAHQARETAATVLPWMVLAAVLQLYAALCASTLASLDDYVVSAAGFTLGSAIGLAFILLRVHAAGIEAVAWGMALNAAIALLVPLGVLAYRAWAQAMPVGAVRPSELSFGSRVAEMGRGVALPLALQGIYLVCVPLAGREGVGGLTSFGYAYLITAAVVAVTASSLGLVTSVPLTRTGIDPAGTARHVVASAWPAVIVIGAAVGVFGLAGGKIVHGLFGSSYGADVGTELGRLVVLFSLLALASAGISVTYPLLFVAGGGRRLPLLAAAVVAVHVPLAILGQVLAGLDGLALALGISTALILGGLLFDLRATVATARGLGVAALTVGALAVTAFVPAWLALGAVTGAALGLVLYGALLVFLRPPPLRSAWRYLRALA